NPLTQTVEVHILVEGVPVLPGQRLAVRFLQKAEAPRTLYRIPARALAQWEGQAVLFQKLSADAQSVRLHALPIEVAQIEADWLYFYVPSSLLLAEASMVTDATTAIKLAFLANEPAPAGEE
ncbi:MAG: hypothetical protein JXR44_05835, partial [Thiotrichales bacterium]|nr:hypothetical protein [Thiotrichales bacterium]